MRLRIEHDLRESQIPAFDQLRTTTPIDATSGRQTGTCAAATTSIF